MRTVTGELADWLREHTAAWHGWPTHAVIDGEDSNRRCAQLQRHGFPWKTTPNMIDEVNTVVAALRGERRGNYARNVDRSGW